MRAIILFSVLIGAVLVELHSVSAFPSDDNWSLFSDANRGRRFGSELSDEDRIRFQLRQRELNSQRIAFESGAQSSVGNWAAYPEAAAFEGKIQGRLESSRVLSNKPDVRQKLSEIANEKFNQCKGKDDELERACLGRVTGQVMQLVSAVENMSRNNE